MRLLCVDDDRINLMLIEHLCLAVGDIEFGCAETGADALALAASWQPQVLVLDLHLPDTTGLALLPRLREALGHAGQRAVLCTAELPEDVADRARDAGFDACWGKPVMLADMQAAVQRWRGDASMLA